MARTRKTIHHLSLTKARATFGQVLNRVHLNHEYFILEKNGVPVVGILNGDELDQAEPGEPAEAA
jgi:hypothetical protein